VQGLVEVVELPQLFERLPLGDAPVAGIELSGIARREMNDEERDERDADEQRDRKQQTPDGVAEQRSARRVPL
jgi:hypothetical protein